MLQGTRTTWIDQGKGYGDVKEGGTLREYVAYQERLLGRFPLTRMLLYFQVSEEAETKRFGSRKPEDLTGSDQCTSPCVKPELG